jgi:hypothetical protein
LRIREVRPFRAPVAIKDFLPTESDAKVITDRTGSTTTVSIRLYAMLTAYADRNRLPLNAVVQQLREEIHRS